MRFSSMILLVFTMSYNVAAQTKTGKEIDQELYKSYVKLVDYRLGSDSYSYDSIDRQGSIFREQLIKYTSHYPLTLSLKFDSLRSKIDILTSSDGLFRIYSWDTWMGGTMHDFENVMQYGHYGKVFIKANKDTNYSSDAGYVYDFIKLYSIKANNKTYYLGVYVGEFSNQDGGMGIQVFTIDDNGLNDTVKLIKTGTDMQYGIYFNFNFFKMGKVNYIAELIKYDSEKKMIYIPIVTEDGKVTNRYIKYQFSGDYFEKIK